jgi:hypothetical protein
VPVIWHNPRYSHVERRAADRSANIGSKATGRTYPVGSFVGGGAVALAGEIALATPALSVVAPGSIRVNGGLASALWLAPFLNVSLPISESDELSQTMNNRRNYPATWKTLAGMQWGW